MFEGWGEYFFMVGSSAAALIGLMFVVVTLSAGRDRQQFEYGKHLYTSPIVWHLAVILLLSGGAIAPTMTAPVYGWTAAVLSLIGIAMGIRSAIGIRRTQIVGPSDSIFDMWWYGIVPALACVGLGIAAYAVLTGCAWAPSGMAATVMALLLVCIHAEWDLVTFLAPMVGQPPEKS